MPIGHWLMRIATNACLNELAKRRRRGLPQLERAPGTSIDQIERLEAADWITPAPDSQLFAPPLRALETRETVALAFLALLQQLPPRQRAVLLLKDVVGWSAEEIAAALEMSLASVNSALHRARVAVAAGPRDVAPDPPPDVLREYIRSWEEHDVESLVGLLRDDVVLAMPPHSTWFRGARVGEFLRSARFHQFWAQGVRLATTRANGQLAFVFYVIDGDGYRRHSIQLVEMVEGRLAQAIQFIGDDYLRGFAQSPTFDLSSSA
ncbi:MAG: sigma factor-like helix-turn-helix DNA-binding protein [Kofleriaceae bacterium]